MSEFFEIGEPDPADAIELPPAEPQSQVVGPNHRTTEGMNIPQPEWLKREAARFAIKVTQAAKTTI